MHSSIVLSCLCCLAVAWVHDASAYSMPRNLFPEFNLEDDAFNAMLVTKLTSAGPVVIQLATLGLFLGVTQYDKHSDSTFDCFQERAGCTEVNIYSLDGNPLPEGSARSNLVPYRVSAFGATAFFNTGSPPVFSRTRVSHDKNLYDTVDNTFETPSGIKYWRSFDNFVQHDIYVQREDIKYFVKYETCEIWSDEDNDSVYPVDVHIEKLANDRGIVMRDKLTLMPIITCFKGYMISLHALRAGSMQARVAGYSFGFLTSFFELQPRHSQAIKIVKDDVLLMELDSVTCKMTRNCANCNSVHRQLHFCGGVFVTTRSHVLSLAYRKGNDVTDFLHCHTRAGVTVFGKNLNGTLDEVDRFVFTVGGGFKVISM